LFGTNGIRGVVNEDMNIGLASKIGMAIGTFLGDGEVAVGTDTRTSNVMLKSALMSGILAAGCSVVDLGVVPTPVVQYHVKHKEAIHGVVITASHNPPTFNGIKCIDSDGTELPREKEETLEAMYFEKTFKLASWDRIHAVRQDTNSVENYIKGIMGQIDCEAVALAKPNIVLDCGNGAGSLVSPYLLERMGCDVVTLNAHPQGTFPGHESEPTPENIQDLISATTNFGAACGIAHDGDADRTIFIDEKGNYLYGDRILALVAREMLRENNGGLIVTTVASSLALDDVVAENKGTIIHTMVGSPIVARKMMESNALFGGEENGGLIFPNHQFCRDGGMAAAKVVEILAKSKKTLSELVAELPKYHLHKTKVTCPNELKEPALKQFAKIMEDKTIDDTDGVKILMEGSWVLVRPSGTEPIYRIFAEAESQEKAKSLAEDNKKAILDIIASLSR
jgi:phosphomannomutase/phosphoglucomutase